MVKSPLNKAFFPVEWWHCGADPLRFLKNPKDAWTSHIFISSGCSNDPAIGAGKDGNTAAWDLVGLWDLQSYLADVDFNERAKTGPPKIIQHRQSIPIEE